MYTQLKNWFKKIDTYLLLSFLIGTIPASFIIHVMAVDFSGFYFQAISFLKYHGYSYQIINNYCDNPLNSGLNARAPFVPLFLSLTMALFGKTLLGIYLPFLIARIFILPLTYKVASYILPKRLAFLASLLLVFIPKLQTYSFGAFEADIFIGLFYILALFFYFKSKKLLSSRYAIFCGLSLGLAALSKSTGFAMAIGFLMAVFLEKIKQWQQIKIRKNGLLLVVYFLILIAPYLLWTITVHKQLYITTQHDRSFTYILTNLPSLLYTIPLYLGVNFSLGLKASIVAGILFFLLMVGIIKAIKHNHLVFILPTFISLVLISTLSTCVIGGNIPGNIEFVTILGFTMLPTSILFIDGAYASIQFLCKKITNNKLKTRIVTLVMLIIFYKFMNNYFTAKYSLDFVPTEYYISLPTIIKQKNVLPDVEFIEEKGLRIFKGPVIHKLIRQQFTKFRFKPFSPFYKALLLLSSGFALNFFMFDSDVKTPSSKIRK